MMIMGELAIMLPKPLHIRGGVLILILGGERKARGGRVAYIAIQPSVFVPVLCRTSRGFVEFLF